MKTIHKYEIPNFYDEKFKLGLPKGAVILSFQTQHLVPVLWAMIDTDAIREVRRFRIYGTGHPIEKIPKDMELRYIGTTQQSQNPPLVWHLFEEVTK